MIGAEAAARFGRGVAQLIIDGEGKRRVVLLGRPSFSIGRGGDNDLVLRDQLTSRRHARLLQESGRVVLEDLQSRHGTWVNGRRIERVELRHGNRILLGKGRSFELTFQVAADSASTGGLGRMSIAEERRAATRHLDVLLDVTRAVGSSLNVDDVLNVIMDSALDCAQAQRGFFILREPSNGFAVRLARHILPDELHSPDFSFSHSVVDRAISGVRPLILHDVHEAAEFRLSESIDNLKLRFIACIPLTLRGEVSGVLYLDSRHPRRPMPTDQVELLLAIAAQAAISLENAQLYQLAILDPLTGIHDRLYFEDRLEQEFQRALRRSSPLSVLFIDLDRFKRVNDTWGHPAGDRVLREVAQVLPGLARVSDTAARYGGEEFVLLAPETPVEQAEVLAERIRTEIGSLLVEEGEARIRVTVSIGVGMLDPARMDQPSALIESADRAMYLAKAYGGNCVCLRSGVGGQEAGGSARDPAHPARRRVRPSRSP